MAPIGDLPQTIITLTVWTYWFCVGVLVVRSHLRFRTSAGSLPRTSRERGMWALWVPAIILWQILPVLAAVSTHPLLALPRLAVDNQVILVVRWVAALLGVAAFGLTVPCWLGMGRNWSMAIVPRKRSRLITEGMFSYVRHPIYALSILLMLATTIAIPTPAMATIGAIHIVMLYLKTRNEERYLRNVHGRQYEDYCIETGRFFPRILNRNRGPLSDDERKAA